MVGGEYATYIVAVPKKLIFRLIVIYTAMVSVATAMVGVVAFVGLTIPQPRRLMRPADYTFLLSALASLGAC
jgi:iron complex transport system permease protein